ncbi:ATP-binding protein [Amycolatopsis alkalitolerans]|uniref:ATP-binding protein n=1 Tax=Amycolatopsis alkalitolerans TaxID=2547244 RepID=UPI001358096C|nr:NB-ARC domain-containing protein [Amycolatopsis alkalitolerans]
MTNSFDGTVTGPVVQAGSVRSLHVHARRAIVTPAQLPLPPPVVAGRVRELAALDAYRASAGRLPLVILTGPAGTGKTTLALHWLHSVRAHYRDGQLYADLAAFDPAGPTPPDTVLHRFLTALGMPADDVPAAIEEREAAFRSLTAERAIAVLLDNAVSAAQVRPLLPATAEGVAVVTSRWRLAGLANQGHYVELGPLGTEESAGLLAELVGRARVEAEPQAARALSDSCGGLPLALAVVSARLRTRPHRSLQRETASLRRRFALLRLSSEELSLQAVFDASVVRLSPAAARLYRLGGLHPGGGFDADVLTDVSGAAPEEVDDGLEELLDANLLTEDEQGRFRFHDLVRAHALDRAEQDLPEPSRRDIVEWYLMMTVKADAVVHPHRWRLGPRYAANPLPRPVEDAGGWLDREQASIRSAVLEADRRGWSELVWQFCEALWGFFLHHRHYQDWIELQRLGIAAAEQCGNRLAEARLRSQLGFAYAKIGRFREAVAENELALRLGRAEKHDLTMATALSQLGRAARGSGDLLAALDYFRDAAGVQARIGVPRGVALCRRRAGEVLADLGRIEEAEVELTAAARGLATLDDPIQYARTLTALGALPARRGRPEEGLPLMVEALAMTREAGSPHYVAEVLFAFGELDIACARTESASEHLGEAQRIYESTADPRAELVAARLAEISRP